MARNKISDLRNHLFEVIEKLQDEEQTNMTIEKAEAIANVAQVIINSAKLEIDFAKAVHNTDGLAPKNEFLEVGLNTQNKL